MQTIPATEITLRSLKQTFGLKSALNPNFFSEWSGVLGELSEAEKNILDRVKSNFLDLMENPPLLERKFRFDKKPQSMLWENHRDLLFAFTGYKSRKLITNLKPFVGE